MLDCCYIYMLLTVYGAGVCCLAFRDMLEPAMDGGKAGNRGLSLLMIYTKYPHIWCSTYEQDQAYTSGVEGFIAEA